MTQDPYERAIWETRELREMDAEEEAYSELLSKILASTTGAARVFLIDLLAILGPDSRKDDPLVKRIRALLTLQFLGRPYYTPTWEE